MNGALLYSLIERFVMQKERISKMLL